MPLPLAPSARPVARAIKHAHQRSIASMSGILRSASKRSLERNTANVKVPTKLAQSNMMLNIRHPSLFVPLPLAQWPRAPVEFAKYLALCVTSSVRQVYTRLVVTWPYKPRLWKRSQLRIRSRAIARDVQALHANLWRAVAADDRPTLQRLCNPQYFGRLESKTLRRRAPGERVRWEIVKYHRAPRLVANLLLPGAANSAMAAIQQCVVTIDATQRLTRIDPDSRQNPADSAKVERRREHLMVTRKFSIKTFEPSDWVVWGTVEPTDLEKSRKQDQVIDAVMNMKAKSTLADIFARGKAPLTSHPFTPIPKRAKSKSTRG